MRNIATPQVSKDENIHNQILDATLGLYQTFGLYKVTMDDVAKAIGKARSSLYYYFKSKEEIYEAVIERDIKAVLAEMEKATDLVSIIDDKIYKFFITKLVWTQKRRSIYKELELGQDIQGITGFSNSRQRLHLNFMKQQGMLLKKILHEAVTKGEIKTLEPNIMDNLVFVLLSSLSGLKKEMKNENNTTRLDESVQCFVHFIIHGLKP